MLTALAHMPPGLENHLWQSTAFAALAWLLAFALRQNQARTRYWIWLAASLKFLLPFSLLFAIGNYLRPAQIVIVAPPPVTAAVQQIAQPFSAFAPISVFAAPVDAHDSNLPLILLLIWTCGAFAIAFSWWRRWRRVRKACATATPLPRANAQDGRGGTGTLACVPLDLSIKISDSLLEPGVFGILHPVLMLPKGVVDRLTPAQMNAILAHEMSHVRRRDNLTAALHMFVEAVFWFHPIVWWIGARLVEERENACDEEVMRLVARPETYAEGILEVCKFYTESPIVCVSGVSGADLKKRIVRIMSWRFSEKLTFGRKMLLGMVGCTAVVVPLIFGVLSPMWLQAQSPATQTPEAQPPSFEVASIKKDLQDASGKMVFRIGPPPGDVSQWTSTNITAKQLIGIAYGVKNFQIDDGPSWLDSERFDVDAKVDDSDAVQIKKLPIKRQEEQMALMLRSLLADRFKLQITRGTKEGTVLALVIAKEGSKLKEAPPPDPQASTELSPRRPRVPGQTRTPPAGQARIMMDGGTGLVTMAATGVPIADLVNQLAARLGEQVVDHTGLTGTYQYTLQFAIQGGLGPDGAPLRAVTEAPQTAAAAPSAFTALQEQLGLKLESTKGPIEIITIDHIEEPSEN